MNFQFWFKNDSKQEESFIQRVQFIAEQDGVPEQILKGDLNKFFSTVPVINNAYLARVIYNDRRSSIQVALCVSARIESEKEKQNLLKEIEKIRAVPL